MPIVEFIIYLNNGQTLNVYSEYSVKVLKGKYKKVIKRVMTDNGWKETEYVSR